MNKLTMAALACLIGLSAPAFAAGDPGITDSMTTGPVAALPRRMPSGPARRGRGASAADCAPASRTAESREDASAMVAMSMGVDAWFGAVG